jgi:hypothetical protein
MLVQVLDTKVVRPSSSRLSFTFLVDLVRSKYQRFVHVHEVVQDVALCKLIASVIRDLAFCIKVSSVIDIKSDNFALCILCYLLVCHFPLLFSYLCFSYDVFFRFRFHLPQRDLVYLCPQHVCLVGKFDSPLTHHITHHLEHIRFRNASPRIFTNDVQYMVVYVCDLNVSPHPIR